MNQGQDSHAPESQPTRQGRRLIRMLFRSNVEDARNLDGDILEQDSRAEDTKTNSWSQPISHQEVVDKQDAVPAPTSKFASLKRKLFPSQNRRHPRHVPPLIISPISTPVKTALPPLEVKLKSLSQKSTSTGRGNDDGSEQNQRNECFSSNLKSTDISPECSSQNDTPESDSSRGERDNNWRLTGRRTLIDDDDDRDLESALEALDLDNSIVDKTLEEMSKAIDDLRVWKEAHEQATQEAFSKMQAEQEFQPHSAESSQDPTKCDNSQEVQLELKRQQQQRDREAQTLELQKESEVYQLECSLFRTTLDESEATRVEQALHSSGDSEGLALSRLRNELFQLDVKQRQEALLQELQGTDTALDMNLVDVQAFTGELDAILAQFDDTS